MAAQKSISQFGGIYIDMIEQLHNNTMLYLALITPWIKYFMFINVARCDALHTCMYRLKPYLAVL